MILEQVEDNKFRKDLYINRVITPYNEVREEDRIIINRILLKEVARNEVY